MENKYENIDSQNQKVFDLIQEEFQKENLQDEIKLMVAQKIKGTDFASLGSASKLSTMFGNGLYYILGIVVVGAITFYYFSTNSGSNNNTIVDANDNNEQIITNAQVSKDEQEFKNLNASENDLVKESISTESKLKVSKETESEFITIESQEFQHSQTLNINSDLSDEYVQSSFINVLKNLNYDFKEKITDKQIGVITNKIFGKFDDKSVEYSITLKFSKLDRNKVIATLHYKDISQKVEDINVKEIFYESLINELQKYF